MDRLLSFHIASDVLSDLMVESKETLRQRSDAKDELESMESSERVLQNLALRSRETNLS